MTLADREGQVLEAVVSLVDSLLVDFDVVELLTRLTEHCARLLDVESAGLLLAGPSGQLHLMAATSNKTHDLELYQLQRDEGPCVDCHASGQPVSVSDLAAETTRWPHFSAAAIEAGFASVHAVPMRAAGSVIGTLGLFGTKPGRLNAADVLVATTLAHVATVAIFQEQAPAPGSVLPRLQHALTSRTRVEQAEGFLRARLDLPLDEAFPLLRRYAATQGQHLTKVAEHLVVSPGAREDILAGMTRVLAAQQSSPAS
jgi:transcriptional regulator with GAF, ATPase, and Fis domain